MKFFFVTFPTEIFKNNEQRNSVAMHSFAHLHFSRAPLRHQWCLIVSAGEQMFELDLVIVMVLPPANHIWFIYRIDLRNFCY